jgi:3-hydroxyisobutyrate dehydrogenase
MMIAGDYATAFGLDNARKDIDLMSSAAGLAGVHADLLAALQEVYRRASELGHGAEDMSAVVEGFPSG